MPKSLRRSPSLGAVSVADAAQQDLGFYMPSTACARPHALCGLNLFLQSFLSQCCSQEIEESRAAGPHCRRLDGHPTHAHREV